MNRRTFTKALATAAFAAAVPSLPASALNPSDSPQRKDPSAPPFPLSVMLWTVFTGKPFEERLAKVAEAGYTNVELVGEYKDWGGPEFSKANAAKKRLGISFDATAGLENFVGNPATTDDLLDELGRALIPMDAIDCPAMIVLSGNVIPSLTREAQHAACINSLKRAAAFVDGREIAGQPVRLLLECIDPEENPKCFLQSASEALEIVRAVNHPQVQFLYDIYHEQIAEGNLIEKLEKNMDLIGLIHVADVPGRHEPGTGEINYTNIFRKLVQLNYKRTVAMEFKPSADSVTALRAAKAMVMGAV
jgi:hydroxypyruvate isomerase